MFGKHRGRGHGFGRGRGWRHGGHGRRHLDRETTLDQVRVGERLEVLAVDDSDARMQALRLGVCEGAEVSCVTKLPWGPVILKFGLQEIAVGRGLARRIHVRREEGNPCRDAR